MDLTQATFTWAPAAVLVDKPAKIPPDRASSAVLPEKPPAKASPLAITSRGGSAPPRLPSGATARPP